VIPLTLGEIAAAAGARIEGADANAMVTSIVTDSRAAEPGSLFVALRGERADGHDFAGVALANGAVAALVSRGSEGALLRAGDPLDAYLRIGAALRARLGATVIAITGSSGKTCTKDLVAAVCATERATVATFANHNAEIGVPETIARADASTEVLVVEVGSRGVGHIAPLARALRPDISVVTNVGPAHIGMFGSLDDTTRAKAELVDALGADGVAVLNADDERVRAMRAPGRVVTFGVARDADVRAEDVELDGGARASFTLAIGDERTRVTLAAAGEHMVSNALAAAAAAHVAGISVAGIVKGLSEGATPPGRMQVVQSGARTIIDDAYNANPDSMAAALKALAQMGRGRPTWAVLGHMAELGDSALEEHDRIGRMAVRLGVGNLVTIGAEAKAMHEAARLEGMFGGEARFFADADAAIELLRRELEPDAVVLVKASRAAGLERVVEALS
jgi:UDP-N-acetylmuramoyl-tripeptide--D-alanyl-D-alanine ligase